MKKLRKIFTFLILLIMNTINLYGQYICSVERDSTDIHNRVTHVSRINILTGEEEELIDVYKFKYINVFDVKLDPYGEKLFFSYNFTLNYAMIDLLDTTKVVDLSRDTGDWYDGSVAVYTGIGYSHIYHKPTNKLYLFWKYMDSENHDGSNDVDSCAIVDLTTGKNIKAFEAFFDMNTATFSEDGKRLYASKILSPEENRQGKVTKLIIDSEDARIIESFDPEDIAPDAAGVSVFKIDGYRKGVGNKLLVGARYEEGDNIKRYMYVYNMDTKKRSMKILKNFYGRYWLSSDASKIIIDEYDPVIRQYKGIVHVINVEWSGDKKSDRIMSIDEGLKIQLSIPDKLEDRHTKTHSLITFPTNPDVILYQYHNKPFEDSYVIRLSDGKILRGPAKHE